MTNRSPWRRQFLCAGQPSWPTILRDRNIAGDSWIRCRGISHVDALTGRTRMTNRWQSDSCVRSFTRSWCSTGWIKWACIVAGATLHRISSRIHGCGLGRLPSLGIRIHICDADLDGCADLGWLAIRRSGSASELIVMSADGRADKPASGPFTVAALIGVSGLWSFQILISPVAGGFGCQT